MTERFRDTPPSPSAMSGFDTQAFAERCAQFFGKARSLRDATIDASLQTVHSDAYALGKCVARRLEEIAKEVLSEPEDYRDFVEGMRDHL